MADYTTLDIVKRRLSITDTTRDTDLHAVITAASRSIDRACNRSFALSTEASRVFQCEPERTHPLLIDDTPTLATDITVEAADTPAATSWETIPAKDYWLEPLNPEPGWPRNRLFSLNRWPARFIRITASWGWATVPAPIQQVTAIYAARLHRRLDSPLGVTAGNDEFGTLYVAKLDPDMQFMIRSYASSRARLAGANRWAPDN